MEPRYFFIKILKILKIMKLFRKEEIILTCKKCGSTHLISPPKRKLKITTEIELKCWRCEFINNYKFYYKLKKNKKNGS